MKKSNLMIGFAYFTAGIIGLTAALTDSKLSSLLFGFAAAFICSGSVIICRYFYWNKPKNKDRYLERLENEKIEMRDELKTKLRDRSGRFAYISGIVIISISIVIFSILGSLDIIDNSRIIVLYLGGYLVFQILAGIAIFNHLLKKY
ncbi:MAG: hypothetical protein HFE90_09070 [Firmicutes bacterium]|nr:hypothetical protein [Bacillota bacterium]